MTSATNNYTTITSNQRRLVVTLEQEKTGRQKKQKTPIQHESKLIGALERLFLIHRIVGTHRKRMGRGERCVGVGVATHKEYFTLILIMLYQICFEFDECF